MGLPERLLQDPSQPCGRRGALLTPRERGLLALARALLSDPDVMLLYKPTEILRDEDRTRVAGVLLVDAPRSPRPPPAKCGGRH